MTHDELLAKIDKIPLGIEHILLKDALVDVVKLHKPSGFGGATTRDLWLECSCEMEWLCYTVKAIQAYFP